MAQPRNKPYIWPTWIAPLLCGEDNCELKAWTKAHYKSSSIDVLSPEQVQEIYPDVKPFDSVKWNEDHTALLMDLREEYKAKSKTIRKEVEWRWDGQVATLAGKIDLITTDPNLIIDAKGGSRRKDSHVIQMKIYQIAIERGCVPGVKGEFKAVLRYGSAEVETPPADDTFRQRLFNLIKRIAGQEKPDPSPSLSECKYCDLADCAARATEESVLQTAEF